MREWRIIIHFVIKLPSGVDIHNLINDLRVFSWEAADIFIYYSKMLRDSDNKSNIISTENIDNPVTMADLKVNEIIIKRINEKYINIEWEILSEENVKIEPVNSDLDNDWLWVLDPLDWTKEFIQGSENYAMHLALNYKQKPYIGIVLIPERDELWITNGISVWCETRNGKRKETNISKNHSLQKMTIVTSKNHNNNSLKTLIEKINFKKVTVMGSIGCKIASIIRGDSDIYICLSLPNNSAPKDWDFAAPEAILRAAGGAITDLENQNITYNKLNFEQRGIIIASNDKDTHADICLQVKEIVQKFNIVFS